MNRKQVCAKKGVKRGGGRILALLLAAVMVFSGFSFGFPVKSEAEEAMVNVTTVTMQPGGYQYKIELGISDNSTGKYRAFLDGEGEKTISFTNGRSGEIIMSPGKQIHLFDIPDGVEVVALSAAQKYTSSSNWEYYSSFYPIIRQEKKDLTKEHFVEFKNPVVNGDGQGIKAYIGFQLVGENDGALKDITKRFGFMTFTNGISKVSYTDTEDVGYYDLKDCSLYEFAGGEVIGLWLPVGVAFLTC